MQMSFLTTITLVGLVASGSYVGIPSQNTPNFQDFMDALCQVESGCDGSAVGDNGNAIGHYQIWKVYWIDAAEQNPALLDKSYNDCINKKYSEQVMSAYWSRYATKKRLGHEPTLEDLARIHNGGPNGHKKQATVEYWNKVKKVMKNNG